MTAGVINRKKLAAMILVSLPAHEPGIKRPLESLICCEAAEPSPSSGGEGRDEGGRISFQQGHVFPRPRLRFMGAMRKTVSGRSLLGHNPNRLF